MSRPPTCQYPCVLSFIRAATIESLERADGPMRSPVVWRCNKKGGWRWSGVRRRDHKTVRQLLPGMEEERRQPPTPFFFLKAASVTITRSRHARISQTATGARHVSYGERKGLAGIGPKVEVEGRVVARAFGEDGDVGWRQEGERGVLPHVPVLGCVRGKVPQVGRLQLRSGDWLG